MPGENGLDKIALEELLQELRVREKPELKETTRAPEEHDPLADHDTDKIVENVLDRR